MTEREEAPLVPEQLKTPIPVRQRKCEGLSCIADHTTDEYCIHQSPEERVEVVEAMIRADQEIQQDKTFQEIVSKPQLEAEGVTVLEPTYLNLTRPVGFKKGDRVDVSGTEDLNGTYWVADVVDDRPVLTFNPEEALDWTAAWRFVKKTPSIKIATGRRGDRMYHHAKQWTDEKTGKRVPIRYPRVAGCGHKFTTNAPRHRNCAQCWTAYFYNQGELTENLARNVAEQGVDILLWRHGRLYVQEFFSFSIKLAQFEQFKHAMSLKENQGDGAGTDQPLRPQGAAGEDSGNIIAS